MSMILEFRIVIWYTPWSILKNRQLTKVGYTRILFISKTEFIDIYI